MVYWMSGCATEMRHKQCLLKVGTFKVFTVEKFKIYQGMFLSASEVLS